jgi:hypothetical protein
MLQDQPESFCMRGNAKLAGYTSRRTFSSFGGMSRGDQADEADTRRVGGVGSIWHERSPLGLAQR